MKYKNLFSPISIGTLEIKNRLVMAPMVRNYATKSGTVTQKYLDHIESIASGGVGLMILEASYVNPIGKGFSHELGLDNDTKLEGLQKLVKIGHKHGAKIGPQLYHAGRQTSSQVTGSQPVSCSPIACPVIQEKPQELTIAEIQSIENDFADAALRAKAAGFDFIEIHAAHGYLINQFLSPFSNHRTDKYGGDSTNRFRFLQNIITKIQTVIGENFPIIVRLSADELIDGGLTISDTTCIAQQLENLGIHALHISAGNYASYNQGLLIQPMAIPDAPLVHYANTIKQTVQIPVIAVGKIHHPDLAEKILTQKQADLIAIGRPLLADPHWPNKAAADQTSDINLCISCNQSCITRLFANQDVHCTVNPLCGFEKELALPTTTKKPKKILVIGGGPAGLYAATQLSAIGHQVSLYEKSSRLGGQLNLAEKPPFRENIKLLRKYLINQAEKNSVKITPNHIIDEKILQKEQFDIAIYATGSIATQPNIPGIKLKHVISADKVLNDQVKLGKKVIVVGGGCQGAQVADLLVQRKHTVTLVEMSDQIAKEMPGEEKTLLINRLLAKKTKIHTLTKVIKIDSKGIIIEKGKGKTKLMAKNIITCFGRTPNQEQYDLISQYINKIFNIGDSHQVGRIEDALRSAAEICQKIS